VRSSIKSRHDCQRISRSVTIRLNAQIEKVFPLFGPVREKEWAFGWEPEILYARSPLIEEKMIFRTRGVDGDYTWVVTKYQPENHAVEYAVHTVHRIWFITVCCRADGENSLATVTYTYTSLSDEGASLNEKAMKEMFQHDLIDWEEAINYYLLTAQVLQPKEQFNTLKQ